MGLSNRDIDNQLKYDDRTGEVYFGGKSLGKTQANVDGVSYYDSDTLNSAFNDYVNRAGITAPKEQLAQQLWQNLVGNYKDYYDNMVKENPYLNDDGTLVRESDNFKEFMDIAREKLKDTTLSADERKKWQDQYNYAAQARRIKLGSRYNADGRYSQYDDGDYIYTRPRTKDVELHYADNDLTKYGYDKDAETSKYIVDSNERQNNVSAETSKEIAKAGYASEEQINRDTIAGNQKQLDTSLAASDKAADKSNAHETELAKIYNSVLERMFNERRAKDEAVIPPRQTVSATDISNDIKNQLMNGVNTISEITRNIGANIGQVNSTLFSMELNGEVKRKAGNTYELTDTAAKNNQTDMIKSVSTDNSIPMKTIKVINFICMN